MHVPRRRPLGPPLTISHRSEDLGPTHFRRASGREPLRAVGSASDGKKMVPREIGPYTVSAESRAHHASHPFYYYFIG